MNFDFLTFLPKKLQPTIVIIALATLIFPTLILISHVMNGHCVTVFGLDIGQKVAAQTIISHIHD